MALALTIIFLFCGLSVSNPPSDPLSDQRKSGRRFCKALAGSSNGAECFIGESPDGLCLEKLDNGAYINMVPHPDGSNQVFLSNQQGLVWLAKVPDQGSNKILEIVESNPFLDITSRVVQDSESGLMGMAFHPNFEHNGRFFLSYICDKTKQLGCSGRCLCNTDVNCDPSKLNTDGGVLPCQYQSVIAEFTGNHTGSQSSYEVRRILTMGLPSKGDHGGQILFGPDGYLYFMMGDSSRGDVLYNFAQNKKSLIGKIMRLDINHIPSAEDIYNQGLWGNYSIPRDNPYANDTELAPEIWAMGFRNPWRCSFDSERPSYFLCGDCGQDEYEEVDRVIKGGNYGWRMYEGPYLSHPREENTSTSSISTIFPVMGQPFRDRQKHRFCFNNRLLFLPVRH